MPQVMTIPTGVAFLDALATGLLTLSNFYAALIGAVLFIPILGFARSAWLLAALTLPIAPDAGWKPPDAEVPIGRITAVLVASVGAPYLLPSSWGRLLAPHRPNGLVPYLVHAICELRHLIQDDDRASVSHHNRVSAVVKQGYQPQTSSTAGTRARGTHMSGGRHQTTLVTAPNREVCWAWSYGGSMVHLTVLLIDDHGFHHNSLEGPCDPPNRLTLGAQLTGQRPAAAPHMHVQLAFLHPYPHISCYEVVHPQFLMQ